MTVSLVAAIAAVALTAVSQLLFKQGSTRAAGRHWVRIYLNRHTIVAYFLLLIATLLNTYAYKILPMKLSVVILPVTFILIGALSRVILKERLSRTQALGGALVIVGIAIFNGGIF
jgi:drug/metabolite transporter (DMT)-like permease